MTIIWGFDLGVASVGFAVIRQDTAPESGEILRLGVRIFPESREAEADGRPGEPLNATRRLARLKRRQVRRKRWRRIHLRTLMAEAGLLPDQRAEPPRASADPVALRLRGLHDPLTPEQLGWALFHLLKRRGYDEATAPEAVETTGREKTAREKDEQKKQAEFKDSLGVFRGFVGTRTLAEALTDPALPSLPKRRKNPIERPMVTRELDTLWAAQARHHPTILTDDLRRRLQSVALSRRPTFFRAASIGRCSLLPDQQRTLKAEWIAQQVELLQFVNALRLTGGNARPLDPEERARALAHLATRATTTWAQLRSAIGLPRSTAFTHEEHGKQAKVRGNATEAAIRAALAPALWDSLAPAVQDAIRQDLPRRLHAISYAEKPGRFEIRPGSGRAAATDEAAAAMARDWGLPAEAARKLAEATLPPAWSRHSRAALEQLLPHLEAGLAYATARERAFPEHRAHGDPLPRFPEPQPQANPDPAIANAVEGALGGIRNPTVMRTLGELQKVANTLLRAHGRPDAIRIELARDLKRNLRERAETLTRNRAREKERKDAAAEIGKQGKPATAEALDRVQLLHEQGCRCPYTGETISLSQALDGNATQIDHIVPRSRGGERGLVNCVLCAAGSNAAKGDRTPQEWLASDPARRDRLATVWASMLAANKAWAGKHRRLLRTDAPDIEGFTSRQLNDTAYAAVAARAFLGLLWGGGQAGMDHVSTVSGRATALVREGWKLGLRGLLGLPETERAKLREDHRHHAVDALAVALTSPAAMRALSIYWQRRERGEQPRFAPPWPHLQEEARAALHGLVVSHRVDAKLTGQMHEETYLGRTAQTDADGTPFFAKRKAIGKLKPGEILGDKASRIADAAVQKAILAALAAAGLELRNADGTARKPGRAEKKAEEKLLAAALARPIHLPKADGSPGPIIRRVRVHIRRDPEALLRAHPTKNMHLELGGGTNHHVALYRDGTTIRFLPVTRREAFERQRRGKPAVLPRHPEGGTLLFALCSRDVLMRETPEGREFVLVRKFNAAGRIFYKPLTLVGEPKPEPSFGEKGLVRDGWRKVSVDPIGRVRPAR